MRIVATLLSELGFKRVVGLLDGNRMDLVPELEEAFPQYHFHTIPADDIRTKSETKPRKAVSGILDESGDIRPEYVEPIEELLTEVNQILDL